MTTQPTPTPVMNDLWAEALANALETAGAWDAFASLSKEQRALASMELANWAEHMDDGASPPPSNPEGDAHAAHVAELRYWLAVAEKKAEVYRQAVGNSRVDKLDADAMVENALRSVTR